MPSNRMHRGLVALSASAVAAVYLAGYLRTQSAEASIAVAAVATPTPVAVAAAPAATATPAPQVQKRTGRPAAPPQRSAGTATPATAPSTTGNARPAAGNSGGLSSTSTTGAYRDGTYTGSGSSRRGDVWVSVDVQGGKISQVTITRSTLQYPLRDIAGLPAQVVERQSPQVDIVSRATYSSQAFRTAVSQALAKAG
jgi:major membrane immunogen (membrane-anchored lipoprotein)